MADPELLKELTGFAALPQANVRQFLARVEWPGPDAGIRPGGRCHDPTSVTVCNPYDRFGM